MTFPLYSLFSNEWITFGFFFIAILALLGLTRLVSFSANWKPENSRKFIHIVVGIMILSTPFIFQSNLPPVTLSIIFIGLNFIALQSNKFQAIHAVRRESYGTVYFPLSFLILALFWWHRPVTLIVAVSLMTFADTFAAIVGEHYSRARQFTIWTEKKSVEGSTLMFVSSFGLVFTISILFSWYSNEMAFYSIGFLIGLSGFVAMIATLSEAVSHKGSDNFSVPILSAVTYEIYIINHINENLYPFLIWTLFSFIVILAAYRLKALSSSGSVITFIMGVIIFGIGGLQWVLPLVVFFLLSSMLSKIGKEKSTLEAKGSQRNILQVLANGCTALLIALIFFYRSIDLGYLLFLGAVAASTADTWATEIGFFSKNDPHHILSRKSVAKGTSGGVTILGTVGSFLGAIVIGLTGWLFGIGWYKVLIVSIAGLGSSLIDSMIGGSVQAFFTCPVCGKTTEKRNHCNRRTHHQQGWKWVDNDMVNLINTIAGTLIVFLLLRFLVR